MTITLILAGSTVLGVLLGVGTVWWTVSHCPDSTAPY
jgi:hypothetical protein